MASKDALRLILMPPTSQMGEGFVEFPLLHATAGILAQFRKRWVNNRKPLQAQVGFGWSAWCVAGLARAPARKNNKETQT